MTVRHRLQLEALDRSEPALDCHRLMSPLRPILADYSHVVGERPFPFLINIQIRASSFHRRYSIRSPRTAPPPRRNGLPKSPKYQMRSVQNGSLLPLQLAPLPAQRRIATSTMHKPVSRFLASSSALKEVLHQVTRQLMRLTTAQGQRMTCS